MKTQRKTSADQSSRIDDEEAPIQKSNRAIWAAIFIFLILAGLGYLLFSSLGLESELNRQQLLMSAIALMLLIVGLLVFIRAWFTKNAGKKKKTPVKARGNKSRPKTTQYRKKVKAVKR
ncbi:MAG: hypothetical protein PHE04_02075 [Bacteroidales bacterium]|nr:hypothetical protein [Bacteroidales bacterium]MDD3430837.1 hypothetical protein [Bacteroidales bacterium]MDD4361237.1 hypothetical protein [Bacteroidales bacterium]MDD4430512.1 hypothetical protein [Bacteroidales bacterium]